MVFKRDCVYYEVMRPEQYQAYCNKLNRVIKVKDCEGCGWYELAVHAGSRGEKGRDDLTKFLQDKR